MAEKTEIDGEKVLLEKGFANRYSAVYSGNAVRISREYVDSLRIEMRVLGGGETDLGMELFGTQFKTPVMTAALSGLDTVCTNGMVEFARGAAAAGSVMWCGIGSGEELEALTATGAKVIKIIKPYADEKLIFEKITRAEKCGVLAIGMDIDFFYGSKRKKGFAMEYPVSPKTSEEIKSYIQASKLPFIAKGVLSEWDAEIVLRAGAGGIVVSHHGGSVLDYAVPPLMVLPQIVKLAGSIPVFIDGGFTSGSDVFKALAFGARGVSVGRPLMAGLATDGAEGVTRVITDITGELGWIMKHTAARSLKNIDPSLIHSSR